MKIVVTALIIITVAFVLITCFFDFRTDEEKIEDQINNFVTAYNDGDLEKVLDSLDSRTRNALKSTMNITETLLGSKMKVKLSDLFSVSVGLVSGEDDILKVTIDDIDIQDDKATVNVSMTYRDKANDFSDFTGEAVFTMVKEDRDWYIRNFKDR